MLRTTAIAYWELAFAALTLQTRHAALAEAREQQDTVKALVREGVRPQGDMRVVEHAILVREESVLAAELLLEERALQLRKIVGLEIGPNAVALWPAEMPPIDEPDPDLDRMMSLGLAQNPSLRILAVEDDSASLDVKVARNGLRPRLDVFVSAGAVGQGRNFDESLRALDQKNAFDVTAGATLSIEIGRNTARGEYASAQHRQAIKRIEIEDLQREVAADIVMAVHRMRTAHKRVEVTSLAIELARTNLRAERALHKVGRSDSFKVFERQDEVDEARLSRVRAFVEYHQAAVELRSLTGEILSAHGLEVLDADR